MKIEFDYSFDSNGFFNAPERKEALEYAGKVWSNLLKDDFAAIPIGSELTINNPTNGNPETIVLETEIDDLRIFVGSGGLKDGANLKTDNYHLKACACNHCNHTEHESNRVVNLSNRGILDTENIIDTDSLLAQAQVNGTDLKGDIYQRRISSNYRDTGVVTDFEPWTGTISFSPDETIDWNFDLENTNDSQIDFISVALHEIGHVLGIGVAPIFDLLGDGASFTGVNALAINNGVGIPLEKDLAHVVEGFNGNSVLLDPLLNDNRNSPSDFDLAILADIGYEIEGFNKQGLTPEIATDEAEDIIGSDLEDRIDGEAGDDRIQGNDGNDTISGGFGNDTIFGTAGEDFIQGNDGIDSLHGGLGKDTIDGGIGDDLLVGGEDNDLILGRDGDDELQGNVGEDILIGGAGNDSLFGQNDADFLIGNEGEDRLQGDSGNDSLQGNQGNDTILGQAGDDLFDGGAGDDLLVGGAGSDRFFFGINNGNDTINDFIVAEDVIEISADLGFSDGKEILETITRTGVTLDSPNLFSEITFSENNTISIFHDTELLADNFAIVSESSVGNFGLSIVALTPNSSGFAIEFNERLDAEVLDSTDLSLIRDTNNEAIFGSLKWDEDNLTLSFMATDGVLESDLYHLNLISSEDGFVSDGGELLDGDGDNITGGDFVSQFTIDNSDRRVLALEDFNLTTGASTTLDVSLDNGAGVTKAEFSVVYNPGILNLNDLAIDSELANDWTITTENLDTPGLAIVTVEGTTALNTGEVDLLQLQVSTPDNATYGISDLVTIDNITLNEGNLNGIGETAIQTVALTGDVDGDGNYSTLDSHLISQLAVGLADSLDAYPLIDSSLIADVNRDGLVSALDSFLVAQQTD